MTVRDIACRLMAGLAGSAFATAACAHPGHGAPQGHSHGLFEALVLVGVVAIAIWIVLGRR